MCHRLTVDGVVNWRLIRVLVYKLWSPGGAGAKLVEGEIRIHCSLTHFLMH